MRYSTIIILLCFLINTTQSQTTVPNGSFENWNYVTNSIVLPGWNVNNGFVPDFKVIPDTQYVCADSLSMLIRTGGVASTAFAPQSSVSAVNFCVTANIDTPDVCLIVVTTYSNGVLVDSIPSLINMDLGPFFDIDLPTSYAADLDSVGILIAGGSMDSTFLWVDQVTVDTSVASSIFEPDRTPVLNVYPNPCTGNRLYIQMPESRLKTVRLYDVHGGLVSTETGNDLHYVETSTLQPGMYILHCTDEIGRTYTSHFVR